MHNGNLFPPISGTMRWTPSRYSPRVIRPFESHHPPSPPPPRPGGGFCRTDHLFKHISVNPIRFSRATRTDGRCLSLACWPWPSLRKICPVCSLQHPSPPTTLVAAETLLINDSATVHPFLINLFRLTWHNYYAAS